MSQVSGNVLPQEPQSVDTDHMLGWLENKLVFVRSPLKEIIGELQRYYDLPIETMNPELNEKTLTATFENLPIETVLSSICLTLDVQYTVDNETYRIMDKP
jgi:transmembrane sensor